MSNSFEDRRIIRDSFERVKRVSEQILARNAYRLRIAREQWQRAADEGR